MSKLLLFSSVSIILSSFFAGDYGASVETHNYNISSDDLAWISKEVEINVSEQIGATPEGHWIGYRHWPEEAFDQADGEGLVEQSSEDADCFGLGSFMHTLKWFMDLKPLSSDKIYTRFFLTTRKFWKKVEIPTGDQFGLEWTDFDPNRPTIIIIHGFMSYSNESWVRNMTTAFLAWKDVNVLTIDWSRGGQTWKYWRAVANTRTVGTDVTNFLIRLMATTGCTTSDFHFVGHSLGAHICSFAAARLRGVKRITGLDPAQPCFRTKNKDMLLDPTDAEYVDIIHTNGRILSKIGFGLPEPSGHADFYPNGGMKQPGCFREEERSIFFKWLPISPEKLKEAICSHGRAHLLFIESLLNKNCSFIAYNWDMSYNGINSSVNSKCNRSTKNCGIMGIDSYSNKSFGQFYVVTGGKFPYCVSNQPRHENRHFLVSDLLQGDKLNSLHINKTEDWDKTFQLNTTLNSGWWLFG